MALRSRKQSASSREIGSIPKPLNPRRRNSTKANYRLFCELYFPEVFCLEWSEDHLKVIAKIERAVLQGLLSAIAMPRGSGKTVLCMCAAIWALLHGHRRFVSIIGATDAKAVQILENIKAQLAYNDLLAEDFPEVCMPIRALEGDARRASGQICDGRRTRITWTNDKLILPDVEGSKAARSTVTVCGITGSIRGQNHTLPDGSVIRPDLVLPDDPQDRESANSDSQCEQRIAVLNGDILGMAGPGERIAGLMPCTVIRAGDMADRILNRKLHPDWQGERCKLMYALPENVTLWETYAKIRASSLENDGDGSEATDYYARNRDEMDRGAKPAWPQRFDDGEISAVQNAMNLKLRDEAAFFAEYQNEPKSGHDGSVVLSPQQIMHKINGLAKGALPIGAQTATGFIDVQDAVLYFGCVGWEQDATGYVLDYGAWPDQRRQYFLLRDASPTLQQLTPGDKEGAIYAGLIKLIDNLFGRIWHREDGATIQLERLLIDVGYKPEPVNKAIRAARKGNAIIPSRGLGITAAGKPIAEYRLSPGEKRGDNWYLSNGSGRELRHIRFDANYWKTRLHDRLALPLASRGGITLFGSDPHAHRMLADHVGGSEYAIPTEGRGRKLFEWKHHVSKPDNHLFDVIVGCAVAASTTGIGLTVAKSPVNASGRVPKKAVPLL